MRRSLMASEGVTPAARHRRTRMWRRSWLGVVSVVVLVGALSPVAAAAPNGSGGGSRSPWGTDQGSGFYEHRGAFGEVDRNVCSVAPVAGTAHCNAWVRTDAEGAWAPPTRGSAAPAVSAPGSGGYGPPDLQAAYHLPGTSGGSGRTVAVVDAYDNPNAEADLAQYRAAYGLTPCTTANGCFRKVDQNGGTTYPAANVGWGQEIALDLDMVSATCPGCKILLVEAASNSFVNLGTAVNRAASMGAVAVSNSYGGTEFSAEGTYDSAFFTHPGVAITASSGDNGFGVEYPAASRLVVAVGGTTLSRSNATFSETAWAGAGSGCSAYETKPAWQADKGCSRRTVADVSAVANPSTGVWVYDTYGTSGFRVFGGTSVASPIIASLFGLGSGPVPNPPGASIYGASGSLTDVTSGNNGSCGGSYLCTAGPGYDGPTGLGTPNTAAAFGGVPAAPDFSVGASPASITLSPGGTANSTVKITPTGGFAAPVDVSATVSPSLGLSASLSAPTADLGAGPATLTLGLTAASVGQYTVTVTAAASGNNPSHSTTVQVNVPQPDLTLAASPSTVTLNAGSGASSTVTLTPIGGFSDNVDLSTSVTGTGEVSASVSPSPVLLSGSPSTATVAIGTLPTASGVYTVTVTATPQGGGPSRQTTITVNTVIGDFSMNVPSYLRLVTRGNSVSFTVNVTSTGGFSAPVTFSLTGQSANDVVKFVPPSVSGAGSTVLTITTSKLDTTGSHVFQVKGTSGGVSHTVNVTVLMY